MSVYAEIITGEKKNVLVVPREAITLRQGKRVTFLIKNERAWQNEVELGIKDAEMVEILKGLSSGEKVAISNLDKLKDKERVKVLSE
jgi:multidrug efflux pump subunit AcrA (membrane-fusion protein)